MDNQTKIKEILEILNQIEDNNVSSLEIARQIDQLYNPKPQELSLREKLVKLLFEAGHCQEIATELAHQILKTIREEIDKQEITNCSVSEYYSGMRAGQKEILELLK